jgi:hypothetical protein
VCLHIPFFTTCDNSDDINVIKDYIKENNNAILSQLDTFKQTNNDRMVQLISILSMLSKILLNITDSKQKSKS